MRPFFDAPCDPNAARNAGWFEEAGVNDFKSQFELASRGFQSCFQAALDGGDITAHPAARKYIEHRDADSWPSYTDGRRALHLVRRVWTCERLNRSACEYNSTEATRLAHALVAVEMERWHTVAWSCGVTCGGVAGGAAFDLTTATPVAFYSLWYDVLSSQPGLVGAGNASVVKATLRDQIDLFRNAFWFGEWTLWNGNNWTPHLTIAALIWAVAFFHEDTVAGEVVQMVHRPV